MHSELEDLKETCSKPILMKQMIQRVSISTCNYDCDIK